MRGMERTAQVMSARGDPYSSHGKEENKDPGRKEFQLQSQEKGTRSTVALTTGSFRLQCLTLPHSYLFVRRCSDHLFSRRHVLMYLGNPSRSHFSLSTLDVICSALI
jgi:hypothetical protein